MDTPDEKIIEKIRKLLALATSSNEHEAALAAAKAQDLLFRHNLEMSQIERAGMTRPDPYTTIYEQNITRAEWKIDLANSVARANLCKIILSRGTIVWMGKESNLEVAQFVNATLVQDLERIANEKWALMLGIRNLIEKNPELINSPQFAEYMTPQQIRELQDIHGKAWKNSFYMGAVIAIRERLLANLETIKASASNMNALIVVNGNELANYVHQQFPRLGTHYGGSSTIHGGAYSMGKAAGATLQFRNGIGSGGNHGTRQIGG